LEQSKTHYTRAMDTGKYLMMGHFSPNPGLSFEGSPGYAEFGAWDFRMHAYASHSALIPLRFCRRLFLFHIIECLQSSTPSCRDCIVGRDNIKVNKSTNYFRGTIETQVIGHLDP